MVKSKRKFSEEFKLEAVHLAVTGEKSMTQVSKDLGLGVGLLSRWKREIEEKRARAGGVLPVKAGEVFPGAGHLTSQDEENRQLRRQIAVLTEEREILKKATAFFAKESR